MVYIWAVEALGKGPSEPKTAEVFALFDVCCEKYVYDQSMYVLVVPGQ